MGRGMHFLAALALLWATSTRAASITRADQASLVQQLVRDHRGEASMSFDKAGVAAAVARTAMNHSYPSMLKDTKKRAVFAHMMARLANLVGAAGQSGAQSHNAKDLQAYLLRGIKTEAVLSCLTGPGLTAVDFFLNLPNAIDSIKGCTGDAYCLTKEILGMIGEVGDNLVDLFNIEQDCGKPFLDELLDCSEGEEAAEPGYFWLTPTQKNNPSLMVGFLTGALSAASGVMGALATCQAGEGSLQTPVHPGALIPTSAASVMLSSYEFYQMLRFVGPDGKKAGGVEKCETFASLSGDGLGLFTAIMDTVSHAQFGDGSDKTKGFGPLCAGEVATALSALPDIAGKFCGFLSCKGGFPRGAFKQAIWSPGSSDASGDASGDA